MKILKWIAIVITGLIAVLIIGIFGFLLSKRYGIDVPIPDVRVEITPERVALGTKLAEGIMACGSCHTTGNGAGDPKLDHYLAGDVFPDQEFGAVSAPNITPDEETGLGSWTDGEIIRAITHGVGREGRLLTSFMPWPAYGAALTQEETYSLVAYLRTVPEPVTHAAPKTNLSMPISLLTWSGLLHDFMVNEPTFADYEPARDTPVERGKRLAYLGYCVVCHSYKDNFALPLAGGAEFIDNTGQVLLGANLTPDLETGIGAFSDEELYQSIKFGKRLRPRPETEMVRWPMMPRITHHTSLTDKEIGDIIAFLRSQKAIKNDVSSRESNDSESEK